MPKTIFETVSARIDELIAARDAEIAAAEQAVADAKAAVAAAQDAQDAAIATADVPAYSAARADKEKAEMALEVYSARLAQLENKGYLDPAEDECITREIRAYQRKLQADATEKIIALLSEVEKVGREYWHDQNAADKLYDHWCSSVSAMYRHETKDGELRGAIKALVTNWFYRDRLGVDQYHGTGSFWTE